MDPLSPAEARVLGVLIEKQMTTPDQYPLTLNAITAGANQKNNRSPVLDLSDDEAFAAAEALREKGLASRIEQAGARVSKHRHLAAEKLAARPAELALLAELLLRGPQTVGELRGRASRMQAFESLPATEGFLRSLIEREDPLVRKLPPVPGSRAERYAQLLSPDAHPVDTGTTTAPAGGSASRAAAATREMGDEDEVEPGLADRVAALEAELAELRAAVKRLAGEVGATDPFGTSAG